MTSPLDELVAKVAEADEVDATLVMAAARVAYMRGYMRGYEDGVAGEPNAVEVTA